MSSDAIAAVRELIPWWIPWANALVMVPVAAAVAALSTWVTAAISSGPLRRALRNGELAWAERARLEFPYRRSMGRVRLSMVLMLAAVALLFGDALAYLPRALVLVLTAATAILVSGFVARRYRRSATAARVGWARRLRAWGFLVLLFLRLPLSIALLALIEPDWSARTFVGIGLAFLSFAFLWKGGIAWLMRCCGVLRLASERLALAIAVAAKRCATTAPAAFELDLPVANALAFPDSRTVVVTRRAIELFDDAELAAICTHEVAHLTEGHAMTIGRHAIDGALLLFAVHRPFFAGVDATTTLVTLLAVTIVAIAVTKLVSAFGERRADAIAHASETDPDLYVRTLEKLHRENGIPLALAHHSHARRGFLRVLFGRGGTHGSFVDRAAALGTSPSSGLKPPSRLRALGAVLGGSGVLAVGITALFALSVAANTIGEGGDGGNADRASRGRNLRLALGDDVADELLVMAAEAESAGRFDDALVCCRAAGELGALAGRSARWCAQFDARVKRLESRLGREPPR